MTKSEKPVSGIQRILELHFDVTSTPVLTRLEALERVRAKALAVGIEGTILLSDIPVRRGQLFDLGGKRIEFPDAKELGVALTLT